MNMKANIEVFVTRINGEVVEMQGISDCYTEVSQCYHIENVTDEQLREYYTSEKYGLNEVYYNYNRESLDSDGYFYLQGEAKDITGTIGNVTTTIEKVEVEIN
jgi:hypothetical protein